MSKIIYIIDYLFSFWFLQTTNERVGDILVLNKKTNPVSEQDNVIHPQYWQLIGNTFLAQQTHQ